MFSDLIYEILTSTYTSINLHYMYTVLYCTSIWDYSIFMSFLVFVLLSVIIHFADNESGCVQTFPLLFT